MDDEFKELQTLLRLKKYEQPPQGFESYSERFLKEFHRRQRWEESKASGVAAIWDRVNDWMDSFTVPRYAYAAALAIFGAVAFSINGVSPNQPPQMASISFAPRVVSAPPPALALNSPLDLSDLEVQSQMNASGSAMALDAQPRYILDARPASYDASFSF